MGLNKSLLVVGVLSTISFVACAPKSSDKSLVQDSGSQLESSAIIAGDLVSANDAITKNIVGIYSQTEGQPGGAICTGSLLPGNLVLTAAHCVDDYMAIVFANQFSAAEKTVLPVDRVQISPYWKTRQNEAKDTGDIALLHFVGKIPAGYVPAALLTDQSALKNGVPVLLAGYGANKVVLTPIDATTYPDLIGSIQAGKVVCDDYMKLTNCSESNMTGSGILRKTTVKIANTSYSQTEILLDQRPGTGACHGDSGGPAYVTVKGKLYLWGVTSRGAYDAKNDCSQYSLYTNAYVYRTWLNAAAKVLTSPEATAPAVPKPGTPVAAPAVPNKPNVPVPNKPNSAANTVATTGN